jgi:hypothetical protein
MPNDAAAGRDSRAELDRAIDGVEREAFGRVGSGVLELGGAPDSSESRERGDRRRLGRSMMPMLAPGDAVRWRRHRVAPRFGEVIVFRSSVPAPGRGSSRVADALERRDFVAHRVIGRRADGRLLSKGDGRVSADDAAVDPRDVLGVVDAVRVRGIWRSTDGVGARAWALVAAAVSATGAAAHGVAEGADILLARLRGGTPQAREGPSCRLLGGLQRLVQRVWHASLFATLHRTIEEPDGERCAGREGEQR